MRVLKMILGILAAVLAFFVISQADSVETIDRAATSFSGWVDYDESTASLFKGIATGIKALGFCMIGGGIVMFIGGIKPIKELDIAGSVIFLVSVFIGLYTFFPNRDMLEMADENPIAHALLVAAMGTGLCLVLAASNLYDFIKLKKAEEVERLRRYMAAEEERRRERGGKSRFGDDD